MKYLGVDYGRSKIGLAVGDDVVRLAEPFKIIRCKDIKILRENLRRIINNENIDKIVVGISEGEMEKESREFGENLEKFLKTPVIFHDETLTSVDAQRLSIEAGMGRKKRKNLEDAFAAALMLQNYLERL